MKTTIRLKLEQVVEEVSKTTLRIVSVQSKTIVRWRVVRYSSCRRGK